MSAESTTITLAMLHFVQPSPAPSSAARWTLWPEGRRLSYPELGVALDAMPTPVVISAHVEQGGITAVPLENSAPTSRLWLEHEWRNQREFLDDMFRVALPGAREAAVLLELDDDALVVSMSALRSWAHQYIMTSCGWTLTANAGDLRAPLRLILRRPDGHWSPGRVCAPRAPAI